MIDTITMPLWIFALSIGAPGFLLLCLLGFLLRKIRAPKKDMFENISIQQTPERQPSPAQFHKELLSSQIDTIFNGLNAIIETERLKVRALLNSDINIRLDSPRPSVEKVQQPAPATSAPESQASQHVEPTLEQQVVSLTSNGEELEDVAGELGLSQTEIDLAMRMRSSKPSDQGRKLEAVA